jgi:hypothetical protein
MAHGSHRPTQAAESSERIMRRPPSRRRQTRRERVLLPGLARALRRPAGFAFPGLAEAEELGGRDDVSCDLGLGGWQRGEIRG